MGSFDLDRLARQAEGFAIQRGRRRWAWLTGERASLGLERLYEEDFPSFMSRDLFAEVRGADAEDEGQKRALVGFLAAAHLEGVTREQAANAAETHVRLDLTLADSDEALPLRSAERRWAQTADTASRHEVFEGWRTALRLHLNPTLQHWQDALRDTAAEQLGIDNWLQFRAETLGLDLAKAAEQARAFLEETRAVHQSALRAYLGHLELPIGDAWPADVDWAFRAPRFDPAFSAKDLMPTVARAFRGLGVEVSDQIGQSIHLERNDGLRRRSGAWTVPLDVPRDARVSARFVGGWQEMAQVLRGLGEAQSLVHADPTLPFHARWLGDATTQMAYGLLLEGLVRDRGWLLEHLRVGAMDDFRIIVALAHLHRARRACADFLFEVERWDPGSTRGRPVDYADALEQALHVRHTADEAPLGLLEGPWGTLQNAVEMRAVFLAARVRHFLMREFDEEWWRSPRAGRFLLRELWRPGRRYSAEEVAGLMGLDGLDPRVAATEYAEALRSV